MAKFDEPLSDAELIALRDTHIPAISDGDEMVLQVLADQLEITPLTQEGADFKVYRGTATIPGGSSSVTIYNGTDFAVPRWVPFDRAFIRIASTRHTGIGRSSGGASTGRLLPEWTCHVEAEGDEGVLDRTAGVTFRRPEATASVDCVVDWELIAYVGEQGGPNEFIVRQIQHQASSGSTNSIAGPAASGVATFADLMVWLTGQSVGSSAGNWTRGLWTTSTTDLGGGDARADFTRGPVTSDVSTVSWAMIEFVGSNWTVTRKGEAVDGSIWAPGDDVSFDTSLGFSVADPAKTFLVIDYRTTNDPTGLDDAGDATILKDSDEARHWNRTQDGTRVKNLWIIENSQSSGVARNMNVLHELESDDTVTPLDWRSWTFTPSSSAPSIDEASVIATASVDGTATTYPRGSIGYRLTDVDEITFSECDAGQERRIGVQVIVWPRSQYSGWLAIRQNPSATKTALYAAINALL